MAPSWDPSWNHVGHLLGQKSPKTASRCVPEPTERRPGAVLEPTAAQDAPRHPPGLDLGAFWAPCWTIYGQKFDNICHYFGRFCCQTCLFNCVFHRCMPKTKDSLRPLLKEPAKIRGAGGDRRRRWQFGSVFEVQNPQIILKFQTLF